MLSGSNPAASSNTRRAESLANLAAQSPTQANTNLSSTPNCGTQQQQPGLNKAIPPSTANSAPFSHTPDSTMPSTPMKKENGANNHTESLLTQLSPLNAPQAQQTKKEFVPTPTRSERKLNFGIDCCEMVKISIL